MSKREMRHPSNSANEVRTEKAEPGEMGRVDGRGVAENAQPLKKWDKLVKRNANGQFERGSKALAGAGRPPGSLNRTTVQLKQAILDAAEAAGGEEGMVGYLRRLAVENSSAFSSLLKSVLPTTLTSESDGGAGVQLVFRREIVYPNGHVEIEGVTPKQLPAPTTPDASGT